MSRWASALRRIPSHRRNGRSGPVAFVLTSGCNLGAVQVGMLKALVEHQVVPDMVLGCSVGALNGAAFADSPTPAQVAALEHLWCTVEGRQIMPRFRISPAVALARRGDAIHPPDGLRNLLRGSLKAVTFDELDTPFQCVATDIVTGMERWFDSGPVLDAVMASAAMPAMFPLVEINGRRYMDGGVVNDAPLVRAVELGARTLYVLEVGGPLSRQWSEPKRPLDTAIQAYWIARRHRFSQQLAALPADIEVHLMPHGDPPRLHFHDLSKSPRLLEAAYEASTVYLDGVGEQAGVA